ncbi:agmatine deiminase family protein [Mariniblastus sp.]|nr:agmatine deiminase family protein [Mariniblastus sp.]
MKTTTIGILFALLSLITFFAKPLFVSEPVPAMLSDVGTKIKLVVCSATSARKSSLRNTELVNNIVNGLDEDVHVMLLVNDRAAFKQSSNNGRVTFVEVPNESDITIWPQDPFVVVNDKENTKLITPGLFKRKDDRLMASQLSAILGVEVVKSELLFEGGNIVCGESEVFIGFDTISINSQVFNQSVEEIQKRFAKLFGRRVVTIGNETQDIGHIDLIVTPLSNNRIAVADSRLGAEIANRTLTQSPDRITRFERNCERGFFGDASINALVDVDGNSIDRPEVVGQTAIAIRDSHKFADSLDKIATQLAGRGYDIVRIPALIPNQDSELETDSEDKPAPAFPFMSYNNVLTESVANLSIVYLPQYGIAELDTAAIECWEQNGFEVRPIEGFQTSAMHGGALRCCTKVLLRE